MIFFEGTWDVGTDERALHNIIKMGNVCGHVRVMRFVTLCKIEEMMVDAKQVAKVAVTSDWLPPKNDEATSCLMILKNTQAVGDLFLNITF